MKPPSRPIRIATSDPSSKIDWETEEKETEPNRMHIDKLWEAFAAVEKEIFIETGKRPTSLQVSQDLAHIKNFQGIPVSVDMGLGEGQFAFSFDAECTIRRIEVLPKATPSERSTERHYTKDLDLLTLNRIQLQNEQSASLQSETEQKGDTK